ncbi:MAG: glycosyltransferase family 39 protein [Gemmatimonadetes bacterium]|nr:glycosyltransferase family 39 protein [Gemmatimonadota bacterium]
MTGSTRGGDLDDRSVRWLGAGLFLVSVLATFATQGGYGIVSDVGNYFHGSRLQLEWARQLLRALLDGDPLSVLNREVVSEYWRWQPGKIPHPPLSRELSGLGYVVFRRFLDPLAAYRVAIMLTYSGLVATVGMVTARGTRSWLAGIVAGGAALTIPALFAYGHFANTDLFLASFWFLAVSALYLYTETDRRGWLIAAGLLFGAACSTKFTGVLLLPVFVLWLVLRGRRELKPMLVVLGLAAAVFFATNPVTWVDPVGGIWDYVKAGMFRSISVHIPTVYFGEIYNFRGPWHFAFVWTAIVIPIPLLIAAGLGLSNRKSGGLLGLALVNLGVLYGVTLLPATPLHDGIRLFLAVFPFLCLLAGLGASRASDLLMERGPEWLSRRPGFLAVALLLVVLGFPAARTLQYHPHQLSYFNALVGGVRGAERRGLEITTQKEVLNRAVLSDLVAVIPGRAVIDPGFMLEEICFYQDIGWAPADWTAEVTVVFLNGTREYLGCDPEGSPLRVPLERSAREPSYVFQYHRATAVLVQDQNAIDTEAGPAYEVSVEGVPLLSVFRAR